MDEKEIMQRLHTSVSLAVIAIMLSGCGGVMDGLTQTELVIHLKTLNRESKIKSLMISMGPRFPDNSMPVFQEIPIGNDRSVMFQTGYMWNSLLWLIPPLGPLPNKPDKPIFIVKTNQKIFYIAPNITALRKAYGEKSFEVNKVSGGYLPADYQWVKRSSLSSGWKAEITWTPENNQ